MSQGMGLFVAFVKIMFGTHKRFIKFPYIPPILFHFSLKLALFFVPLCSKSEGFVKALPQPSNCKSRTNK